MVKSHRRACPAMPGLLNPVAIDATAARVAFSKGAVFEPKMASRHAKSKLDLSKVQFAHPEYEKHNGTRRGYLVALGYWKTAKDGKPVFAMRCDCGRYTFRNILDWVKGTRYYKSDACRACAIKAAFRGESISPLFKGERKKHRKAPRMRQVLAAAGFSKRERDLVADHLLPIDDLNWLRGALDELALKGVAHG